MAQSNLSSSVHYTRSSLHSNRPKREEENQKVDKDAAKATITTTTITTKTDEKNVEDDVFVPSI